MVIFGKFQFNISNFGLNKYICFTFEAMVIMGHSILDEVGPDEGSCIHQIILLNDILKVAIQYIKFWLVIYIYMYVSGCYS